MSDAKHLIDMLHRMNSATGERWFACRDAVIAGIELQAEELAAANEANEKLRAEVERLREDAERYRWLANRVLACDYGDNDAQGQIGWRIRSDCVEKDGRRFPVLMYGKSIDAAIDAARKEA